MPKRLDDISLIQVFKLGVKLTTELQNYNDHSHEKTNSMTVVNFLCRKEIKTIKKKANFIVLVTTAIAITSLKIIPHQSNRPQKPTVPSIRPVSALVETNSDNTPPTGNKAVVSEETPETNAHNESILESSSIETPPIQPIEKQEPPTSQCYHNKRSQIRLHLYRLNLKSLKWVIPV